MKQVKRAARPRPKLPLTVEWVEGMGIVELAGALNQAHMVGERSVGLRRCLVRDAGGIGSANADMSSDKAGERPARRKPKVSCATFIGAG